MTKESKNVVVCCTLDSNMDSTVMNNLKVSKKGCKVLEALKYKKTFRNL